jgi:hypothetical protein
MPHHKPQSQLEDSDCSRGTGTSVISVCGGGVPANARQASVRCLTEHVRQSRGRGQAGITTSHPRHQPLRLNITLSPERVFLTALHCLLISPSIVRILSSGRSPPVSFHMEFMRTINCIIHPSALPKG